VEYELDDVFESHMDLRNDWLRNGGKWFSRSKNHQPSFNWNPWDQLDLADYDYAVSRPKTNASITEFDNPPHSKPYYSKESQTLIAINA
jgi:hypothetical protein